MKNEQDLFLENWEWEAQKTVELLRALPADQYDFRPDPQGRSIGELAWHLAEGDAYMTLFVEQGALTPGQKPPGIERPRTVAELAPGYERVHRDAVARVQKLRPEDWERSITFFDGSQMTIRQVLWSAVLHHLIHHRGQLVLMCRLAGATPIGIYGPNREESEKMRAARAKA